MRCLEVADYVAGRKLEAFQAMIDVKQSEVKIMQQLPFTRCASLGASLILIALAGCATTPMPADRFAVAHTAIQRAERADADELAPVPLHSARDKLAAAEASPHNSAGAIAAARLAEEAEVDARVAETTAQAAQSMRASAELDRSLDALRAEANRNTANN